MSTWLIGSGPHAREYAKVLIALREAFQVIGRGEASAQAFEAHAGHPVFRGGVQEALKAMPAPAQAIIAVSFEQLAATALALLKAGTRHMLLEKPAGISVAELRAVAMAAQEHGAQVWVAYNRRFYAATQEARRRIAAEGGPVSCTFEFTEWPHTIVPLALPDQVKAAWVLANSSHVIDLAFHLCGFPKTWQGWRAGALDWHPAAARFCGAGITERDVLFSYQADWEAPGRWAVEVLTRKNRYIFKPMEQLQVVALASVRVEPVELDDQLDKTFKPGLYAETAAFLAYDAQYFCSIQEQVQHGVLYSQMAGYPDADARAN